jgi:hypothetical protein
VRGRAGQRYSLYDISNLKNDYAVKYQIKNVAGSSGLSLSNLSYLGGREREDFCSMAKQS